MESAVPLSTWFEAYLYHHQALNRSAKTISHYGSTFKLWSRYLDAQGLSHESTILTSAQMKHFAIWLRETPIRQRRGTTQRSLVGVYGILKDMRAFLRWLNSEGLLERSVKVPVPRLPQTLFPILTDAELTRIWSSKYVTGRSALATRNRALLGLMLDTGLRRAEVESLTLGALEVEDCLLTVTGKGNKQRRVPFSSSVAQLLQEWIRLRGDEPGSLFWLKAAGVRMVFRRIQEELGLEIFHPHQFRHQAATMMVRNNSDLETVRRILGHSDISTTAKYLSMTDADLRAKHAAASPYDSLMKANETIAPIRRKRLSLKE